MRDFFKAIGGLALLAIFIGLVIGGKLVDRQVQKFNTETAAQAYDSSRQYNQGTNRDIARYCRDWAEAPEGSKKAIADLIRSTLDTFQGNLTAANDACVSKIEVN